jgi:hypothetical protein
MAATNALLALGEITTQHCRAIGLQNVSLSVRPIVESLARSTMEVPRLLLQQPQGPARPALGRLGTSQGNQLGILLAVFARFGSFDFSRRELAGHCRPPCGRQLSPGPFKSSAARCEQQKPIVWRNIPLPNSRPSPRRAKGADAISPTLHSRHRPRVSAWPTARLR